MSDNTATVLDNTNDTATAAVTPKAKGKPGRPVQANSVLAQCKALFVELASDGKNRAEILSEFTSRFGIKYGSAQVYYHEAKNAAEEAGKRFEVKRSPSKPRVAKVADAASESTQTSDAEASEVTG